MQRNLLFFAWLFFLSSLTGFSQENQGESRKDSLQNKEILTTFFLIGDTGHSGKAETPAGLKRLAALMKIVKEERQNESYLIFLGDNFSQPEEMPWGKSLPVLDEFPGKIVFVNGEREWINGVLGLKETQEFLKEHLQQEELLAVPPGCGLSFVDISDEVHLIVLDSQWFIEDWNDLPLINDDCPEIKSRDELFLEIESELKKNQEKTTLIAVHHPLLSDGIHGGNYGWSSFLLPSENKLSVPVVGQLYNLVRTSGGTSAQDAGNPRYGDFISRLRTIGKKWGRVVFVSGHDHSLQYLQDELTTQVVSGSGAITSYAKRGKNSLFAMEEPGFGVLDIFKDGSSEISFFGENKEPMYRQEVFSEVDTPDFSRLPDNFPETYVASVYTSEETRRSDFYIKMWGKRYRELYSTEISVRVADLDTLNGGLEVIRAGGGNQTNSLRLKDSLDREYNIRMLRKDPIQFLQNTAYKNKPVEEAFENTFAERMIRDFYTASHPYAYLAVPALADAAGVLHTNPRVYYLPKQPALEEYNSVHGDALYMIEERPEEGWLGYESFGAPNEDLESTSGLFERLRRDEKYRLDEESFIRARVFDMLIGDWDRHNDQWRWAEIELENGNRVFKAVPRDRDQAFSNFDGWVFRNLKKVVGFFNQFGAYGADISDVEWFNRSASNLDRNLLENSGKEVWLEQADFLQQSISDEVIEEAFTALPREMQEESTREIVQKLKERRAHLPEIVSRYYEELAEVALISGTDKDDIIDVVRLEGGKTRVSIFRNKDEERGELVNERIYLPEETEEVWVYGLDDDDRFYVEGRNRSKIKIKIIGGQNHDVYHITEGKGVKVFDHKSMPNTVELNNGAKIYRTDNYEINTFNKDLKIFDKSGVLPVVGYNPDDGIMLGLKYIATNNGLVRKPFKSRHSYGASYFFATRGFNLEYEGEFAHPERTHNILVGAHYSSDRNSSNYFGFGNETYYDEEEISMDYNRIQISSYGAELGLLRRGEYGSSFKYSTLFESIKVENTEGTFINGAFPEEMEVFERMYFLGLEGRYGYESYDNSLNPVRGLNVSLTAGVKANVEDFQRTFLYARPFLELYTPVSRNEKWVLNPHVQAELNFMEEFEFYHAATLGGKTGLRSFRNQRFAGNQAFSAGTDLRYSFPEIRNKFLPLQLGIFGGYDLGRVWAKGEESNIWHQSYGGGFWASIAKAMAAEFSLFHGKEGFRFAFGFEFGF